MAAFALHALALLLFEHDDLVAAFVLENGHRDACAGESRLADLVGSAFARGQNVLNLELRTLFGVRIAVHNEDIALGNSELLALGFDGGFHKINGEISGFEEVKAREILAKRTPQATGSGNSAMPACA